MKLTSKILIFLSLFFVSGLFASNMLLKKEYDKKDKSDIYWTYNSILEQPFKHLKVTGGNLTKICYEQNKTASVKVLNTFDYKSKGISAIVKNDTLYLNFPNTYTDIYEKDWLKWNEPLRIFSPELLSIEGVNTNVEMFKIKQKNISVNLKGKSKFEIESMDTQFDTIQIAQQDSSAVVFEMSPDYKKAETFHIKYVNARVKGYSIFDIGHAQVDSLQLCISDSSAILLSGGTMRKNPGFSHYKR
jgi:hypothetical protein